jgi:small subunit ribosomal protein S18
VTTRERTTNRPRTMRTNRTRYVPKRKVCFFCANKNEVIDYKNPDKLRNYVSDRAKIEPRRRTGTCAKHQRALATAIKRSRHLALLPFVSDYVPQPRFVSPPVVSAPVASPPVVSPPATANPGASTPSQPTA